MSEFELGLGVAIGDRLLKLQAEIDERLAEMARLRGVVSGLAPDDEVDGKVEKAKAERKPRTSGVKNRVLEELKSATGALSADEISSRTGLGKLQVAAALSQLKKTNLVTKPDRGMWEAA